MVNPNTQILCSQHSAVDGKRVLCVGAMDVQRVLEFVPELLTNLDEEHKHDETVTSVTAKNEGELLAKAKQDWIGRLVALQGADLFRSQGRVRGHQAQLVADPKFGGDVNRVRYNEYNAIAVAGSELQR